MRMLYGRITNLEGKDQPIDSKYLYRTYMALEIIHMNFALF